MSDLYRSNENDIMTAYLLKPYVDDSKMIVVVSSRFSHFFQLRLQSEFLPLELLHLTPYRVLLKALSAETRQQVPRSSYSLQRRAIS